MLLIIFVSFAVFTLFLVLLKREQKNDKKVKAEKPTLCGLCGRKVDPERTVRREIDPGRMRWICRKCGEEIVEEYEQSTWSQLNA